MNQEHNFQPGLNILEMVKGNRGRTLECKVGTVKKVSPTEVELYDGRVFRKEFKKVGKAKFEEWINKESKFGSHIRLPFSWETYRKVKTYFDKED